MIDKHKPCDHGLNGSSIYGQLDQSFRSKNQTESHCFGIGCPPPTLKSSVSLGPESLLESQRLSVPLGFHEHFAACNSHIGSSPMTNSSKDQENVTDLRRKVTPSEDEVKTYPTSKQAAPFSQTDEVASLAEAIKQYDIARLNLEAQLAARKAADNFAASDRIKKDLGLPGNFVNGKSGFMLIPSPPLSRKSSITLQTQSIGLEKIRKVPAIIENENNDLTQPHKMARGFHRTLCLQTNLVEEDGEDDETALHVGFSDQWDNVLMNRAIQESKMMAMNSYEQKPSITKQEHHIKAEEENMKKATNQMLIAKQGATPQSKRATTWSPNSDTSNRTIPSSNLSSAANDHVLNLTAGQFAYRNHVAVSINGPKNYLGEMLATNFHKQIRQTGVDPTNAGLDSPLTMNPVLNFSNSQISFPANYLRSGDVSILERILQKHNIKNHDLDVLLKMASLSDYSPSNIVSFFDAGALIGNNALCHAVEDAGICTQLPNNSQNPPNNMDNLSMRDRNHLSKKRPCSYLSNNCLICRKSFAYDDKNTEKEIVCDSCAFQRKKKYKPDLSDIDNSTVTPEDLTADEDKKWDTIPPDVRLLLATDDDSVWLSDLLCFIRRQIEVFTATPSDVAARSRRGGIKQPIAVGRVGIRCIHCRHVDPDCRAKGAVSYPNSIRIVHQAIRNWQRYHFVQCSHIPNDMRIIYNLFKTTRSHSGNASIKYWVVSCQKLGMVDTDPDNGIRFRDPRKNKVGLN